MARIAWLVLLLGTVESAEATSIKSVTLAVLYREADVVALVDVLAADGESFTDALYRAQVVEAFKGTTTDAVVHFGPYVGYELGSKYVLFAKRSGDTVSDMAISSQQPWPDAGSARVVRIMYAGYSMLPARYTCVIEGCGDGIHVASTQILLPEEMKAVPESCDPGSNYDSWVRRAEFLEYLRSLGGSPGDESGLPNNEMQRTRPAPGTKPRR